MQYSLGKFEPLPLFNWGLGSVALFLIIVLCSNSSWIASNVPSITYGLRGVVHCNIEVRSHIPVVPSPFIHSPIIRSHHEQLKTAILVLTVVVGTSLCGTCERFSPARCQLINIFFNRIQVLAGLTDRNRNVLIPNFCANLLLFSRSEKPRIGH